MVKKKTSSERAAAREIGSDTTPDVVISVRIGRALHERLRKMAFECRIHQRDVILRGIEEVLTKEKY